MTASRTGGRTRRSGRLLPLLALVGIAAAGCMPQGVTEQSKSVNALYNLFFVAGAVVFAIVAGLVTWSIFRYRRRGPQTDVDAPLPPQYHGDLVLEAIWTTLPILTVIGLFAATMVTLGVVQAAPPPDALQIHVTGFQWDWRFDYTGTNVSVIGTSSSEPEMVIPTGRTVHITLTSADVNHAFWMPAFLFKQDAIPGHPNQFSFKVDQAGTYRGQCAEFCGVYHDRMLFTIRAVSQTEFATWLQQQQQAAGSASSSTAGSAPPPASGSPAASGTLESPGAASPPAASQSASPSTP